MKFLELKIPPLIVMISFLITMCIISRLDPFIFRVDITISLSFMFLGVIISFFSVVLFKRSQTTVNPLCPDESRTLVVQGIYKCSRNPMYLSFYIWLFAYGVYTGSPFAIVISPFFIIYINVFQIIPEEDILLKKFGESYLEYKRTVRRWI